jgi:hypothetical protein
MASTVDLDHLPHEDANRAGKQPERSDDTEGLKQAVG